MISQGLVPNIFGESVDRSQRGLEGLELPGEMNGKDGLASLKASRDRLKQELLATTQSNTTLLEHVSVLTKRRIDLGKAPSIMRVSLAHQDCSNSFLHLTCA